MLKKVTAISALITVVTLVLTIIFSPFAVRDSASFFTDVAETLHTQGTLGKLDMTDIQDLNVYTENCQIRIRQSFDDQVEIRYEGFGFGSFTMDSAVEDKNLKVRLNYEKGEPPADKTPAFFYDTVSHLIDLDSYHNNYTITLYVPSDINVYIKGNPWWIRLDQNVEFLNAADYEQQENNDDLESYNSLSMLSDVYLPAAETYTQELMETFSSYLDGTILPDTMQLLVDNYKSSMQSNVEMALRSACTHTDVELQPVLDAANAYIITRADYAADAIVSVKTVKDSMNNDGDMYATSDGEQTLETLVREMGMNVNTAKTKALDEFIKLQPLVGLSTDEFLQLMGSDFDVRQYLS